MEETTYPEVDTELYRHDLCATYAARIDTLPRQVSLSELQGFIPVILNHPYLEAVNKLKDVIFSPDRRLTSDQLTRIEKIVSRSERDYPFRFFHEQDIDPGFHYLIMPRGGDYHKILTMMSQVPNCIRPEEKESVAKYIQKDIDAGACVKIFGVLADGTVRMYLRYYVTLDREDKPVLEMDALEAGDTQFWKHASEWIEAGRGKELLYSIATSFFIAERLGIRAVGLGEFESDEIGDLMGCRRVRVYDQNIMERKIGVPPRIVEEGSVVSPGVFTNRVIEDSYQRILDTSFAALYNDIGSLIVQAEQQSRGTERWKNHPHKKREIDIYNRALAGLK